MEPHAVPGIVDHHLYLELIELTFYSSLALGRKAQQPKLNSTFTVDQGDYTPDIEPTPAVVNEYDAGKMKQGAPGRYLLETERTPFHGQWVATDKKYKLLPVRFFEGAANNRYHLILAKPPSTWKVTYTTPCTFKGPHE
ncbi:hypothetical protein R3P38DRAFT_3218176 [Favolaschia claudopus]|uniref:Uncharacterized protein n=1 Tax=Favolaschia claudopus TaxID=2862362 RepID=A0AAW0A429_9AGAR